MTAVAYNTEFWTPAMQRHSRYVLAHQGGLPALISKHASWCSGSTELASTDMLSVRQLLQVSQLLQMMIWDTEKAQPGHFVWVFILMITTILYRCASRC